MPSPETDGPTLDGPAPLSEAEQEFACDVITTFVEGGVYGWFKVRKYRWSDPFLDKGTSRDAQCEVLEVEQTWHGYRPMEGAEWQPLTPRAVHLAFASLMEGPVKGLHDKRRGQLIAAWVLHDAGDVDADDADVIVQVALLGEVVYG